VLTGADSAAKAETQAMAAWARDEILKLLHPFMPFLTEELWAITVEGMAKRAQPLVLAEWPKHAGLDDEAAESELGWVVDLISAVRSLRAEMNIPPATLLPVTLVGASETTQSRASRWRDVIARLARLSGITFETKAPEGAVQLVVRGEVAALPLKGVIDLAAERTRLEKEIAKADADIKRVDAKLGNADFMARAPEEVVDEQRERREEAELRREKLMQALERLKSAA
jgi:valyl-tRNA synthetase